MAYVGVAIVATLVTAVAVSGYRRSRALDELRRRFVSLGDGKPVRPMAMRHGGSLGRLVAQFDELAPVLQDRIAQLEQDRQQLTAVLGGMAEGVLAVDSRRRLVFANASADRLFGLGPGSVGRLVPELIRAPQVLDAVNATLTSSEAYRGEVTMGGRDAGLRSQHRTLAVHGTPLPGTPGPGALLVFHDVSDLRRLERVRQEFVANVSHELKTPLASIKAYTETLIDWALHDETVNIKFLKRIEEQAERLNQLILDLLSLARLESGQEVYQHGPLVPTPVISDCVDHHRAVAESKSQTLTLDLGSVDGDTYVLADEEAVRQICDNLIDNAIKYTPEGGSVRVSCRLEGDAVVVDVADSGIGIPRDDLPRVFERFYRVDKARSREMGGTGLGLSIVKHLVQSIGGQISVDSRVGVGSTFTVHFPRPKVTAGKA